MDHPSPNIQGIIADLEAEPRLTADVLRRVLSRPVSVDDVAPWVGFSDEGYRRNLIARRESWELRLLCWRPGQSSSMHGHGSAACAFRILRGNAYETVLGERDRMWPPGAVVVEGAPLAHQVGNEGADSLLTLHAYSPPLPVEQPSGAGDRHVAIVGGGFAGVAMAYHLLRRGDPGLRITLVERGPWLGRGVAYGVENPVFRLNVPASKMSIDPSEPSDFVTWAGTESAPDQFLPRVKYGEYVVAKLTQAIRGSPAKLRVARADALAVDGRALVLADGRRIAADSLVLATGIEPRLVPKWLASDPRIVDAWDEAALATLPKQGRILILGSGLSAIDVLALLHRRGFSGSLTILSRRGLLPKPHLDRPATVRALPTEAIAESPTTLRALLRWVRGVVDASLRAGMSWQEGIDSLRPHLPQLWQRLPPQDRSRFVQRVRPYWDILRHRAPQDSIALVEEWKARGNLEVVAARVLSCLPEPSTLEVTLQERGRGPRTERFDAVVRCIGPALELSDGQGPLTRHLVAQGLALRDPAGLGIATGADGAVLDAEQRPSDWIFGLGAVRRASFWETTAVPEIAGHAQALASRILQRA